MEESSILYEVKDRIAYIKLNRPEKMNAFNLEMSEAMRDTWKRFEDDPEAQVAVLTGSGKHFSSGIDLTDEQGEPWQYHEAYPRNGISVFKPIVGAIQGYALGQGYIIAVYGCDITIVADNVMFGFPEGRIGVSLIPPQHTPYMHFKLHLELLLLSWKGGRMVDARRAYEAGMVNKVVPESELMDEAVRWAELLKGIPPLYIKSVKYGLYTGIERKTTRDEREYINFILPQEMSQDKQEAMKAFLEKREPHFTGK